MALFGSRPSMMVSTMFIDIHPISAITIGTARRSMGRNSSLNLLFIVLPIPERTSLTLVSLKIRNWEHKLWLIFQKERRLTARMCGHLAQEQGRDWLRKTWKVSLD